MHEMGEYAAGNSSPTHAYVETALRGNHDQSAWHAQLVAEGKFKPGHRLAIDARLVSKFGVIDGPFTESKEVIGGYWFIIADSLAEAAAIAAKNPCLACGLSYEIRPLELEPASAYRRSNETPT